jgi:polysaccharide chain length determinant protein (PEP-CTERM system associated)
MIPGKKYAPVDYLWMAWRHKWIIVSSVLLTTLAALIVSSKLPSMYQSEMLIQVIPQRVPDSYVRSTVSIRTEDRLSGLSEQIMSRTELQRLITQFDLYPDERARMPLQDVVELMRGQIKVDPVRRNQQTDSFYIRYSYSNPMIATKVTERIGQLFMEVNARDRGEIAEEANDFLQSQLAKARELLEEQDGKLRRFRELNSGRLPTQTQFNMQAIQSTQLELQALVESAARDRDRRMMLERLYNDAQQEPAQVQEPASDRGNNPSDNNGPPLGASTEQQLLTAREGLRRMELRGLTDEHPDIGRAKRTIKELEDRLASEPKTASGAPATATRQILTPQEAQRRERLQQMRAEVESLLRQIQFKEQQEKQLRTQLSDYQRRIEQVPGVESEWIALTRDYETQQQAYEALLRKAEDAKVATELERKQIGEQFRVLDPARMPVRSTGVVRAQVNVLGVLLGFAIGVALSILLEITDTTMRSIDDVTSAMTLPVIASIPYVASPADRQRARMRQMWRSAAVGTACLVGIYVFWTLELWKHLT